MLKKLVPCRAGDGVHILTGPIYVCGAQPGDVLQVGVGRGAAPGYHGEGYPHPLSSYLKICHDRSAIGPSETHDGIGGNDGMPGFCMQMSELVFRTPKKHSHIVINTFMYAAMGPGSCHLATRR